jgi:hypothetical protein
MAEHDAMRDDLSMAKQVDWIPPRPGYILRMRRPPPGTAADGQVPAIST